MALRTKTSPPSAVIYCRVSTAKQLKGVGLEAQETRCHELAQRMGWPVIATFRDEGISGRDAISERPGLAAAIASVESNPGAVLVVYSVSRIARRQRVLWHVIDDRDGLGVPVASATEPFDTTTPVGRAMLGMLAVWATLEADMISERTRDALAEVKARGVRLGAPDMARLGVDLDIVKSLYETGKYSHRTLADELNRRGVPAAKGGKWWPKTVRSALISA